MSLRNDALARTTTGPIDCASGRMVLRRTTRLRRDAEESRARARGLVLVKIQWKDAAHQPLALALGNRDPVPGGVATAERQARGENPLPLRRTNDVTTR